jgi:integrase
LILTGARLREILNLRREWVDLERGLLLLPDSKTGRKSIVLNAPAMAVLAILPRIGAYVITGDNPQKSRADLNRPWRAVTKHAGLEGVRIHDLRHTHASCRLSASCLAIRSPQPRPDTLILTRTLFAAEVIAGRIAAVMGEVPRRAAEVLALKRGSGTTRCDRVTIDAGEVRGL